MFRIYKIYTFRLMKHQLNDFWVGFGSDLDDCKAYDRSRSPNFPGQLKMPKNGEDATSVRLVLQTRSAT